MRVALVCPYDLEAAGGVQQLVWELADRLRAAGDRVTVIGPGRSDRTDAVGVGRPITVRANRSTVPVAVGPRVPGAVRRALAGHDVAHVHEPLIPLVGWAAARWGGPVVATFHADPPRWIQGVYRVAAPAGRRMLAGAVLTAVSRVAAEPLPEAWGEVRVVPNAIDVASYRVPIERRASTVVFLGRDDPRKGLDVLLEAWPRVRSHRPGAELTVMGARRSGSVAGVRFLGRVDEDTKRRELAAASVYVAPHRSGESFGIVLLEAMAAGCRIVASELEAFRAVAGTHARYVPPGDVAGLADALVAALGTATDDAWSAAVRRAASAFDWPVVTDRYRSLYRAAAGFPPPVE